MKRMFTVLMLLLMSTAGFSQYTVTKVVGQVSNRTTGEKLKPGSKLKDDDMLSFSTPNDVVRVIVSGKGVYVITPTPPKANELSMLVEVMKSALKIKSREGYLSGRSEEDEFLPGVLQTEATANTHVIITSENKYLFDPRTYNISTGNKFFIQIDQPGAKQVLRPLKTIGDTLIIYASDLQSSDTASNKKYLLGFYSKEKNSSESLTNIKPYFDSTGEMETIISLVIASNKKADKATMQKDCYAEVYAAMGKPCDITFKTIFNRLTTK